MRSFTIYTIGCKVNQYETQSVAGQLSRRGFQRAGEGERADLVVINTCCVTARAAAKCRQAVARAVRRNPQADVLILGCYATQDADTLRAAAARAGGSGAVHVAGHQNDIAACVEFCASSPGEDDRNAGRRETQAPSRADRARNEVWMRAEPSARPAGDAPSAACFADSISPQSSRRVKGNVGAAGLEAIERFGGHQRAFVKVQDGCDAFCAYCIVPHIRSRVWSRPIDETVREVGSLVAAGHREIVLCGVHLGAFGRDTTVRRKWTGPGPLPELVRRVAEVDGLWRLRLSSLHPGDVTDELLDVLADRPAVAGHLHIPLQSGSDAILTRMGRRHSAEDFLNAVERFRAAVGEARTPAAVTTDVIAGFPGETDDDFAATLAVAREARFSKIHIFRFSAREGTAAWKWRREKPPADVIRGRCDELAELERRLADEFRATFVGHTVDVLVEQPNAETPTGHAHGLTDRYLDTTFPTDEPESLVGRVATVAVTAATPTGLTGEATL